MKSYIFATSNTPRFLAPSSIEALFENGDECFSVVLENDEELKVLMSLLGVQDLAEKPLPSNKDFSALFDYSGSQLPQLSEQDFDVFYEEWLRRSGRESNMDEYGQLVFLQGRAVDWNKRSNRFVLREKA
jgi:hypothetical protein